MDGDEEQDLRKLADLLDRAQQRRRRIEHDPNASNIAARSPLAGDAIENGRLAVLPNTTHIGMLQRAEMLLPILESFLP